PGRLGPEARPTHRGDRPAISPSGRSGDVAGRREQGPCAARLEPDDPVRRSGHRDDGGGPRAGPSRHAGRRIRLPSAPASRMHALHADSRIYVAGHRGMVGSAIVRRLRAGGFGNLLLRNREDLDLSDQARVESFFGTERPEYVFLAAAKAGGIHANQSYPAEFLYENLAIQTNVIHAAWNHGVR